MTDTKRTFDKDPDAELDYIFDWAPKSNDMGLSDWLSDGETIVSHTVEIAPVGLTKISSNIVNGGTSVQIWLDGGTVGIDYTVTCSIVTSNNPPRKDDRSFIVQVKER